MPPITWKNVNAPTALGASKILEAAGKSMNLGLGQLGGLSKQIGATQTANQVNQNRINTEAALSGISGIQDLDALAAAKEAGTYGRDVLPAGTDMAAVSKAMQNQNVVIDDRLSKQFAAANRATTRTEQPIRQEAINQLAAGNIPAVQAAVASGDLGDTSGLSTGIASYKKQQAEQQRAAEDRLNKQMVAANAPHVDLIKAQQEADIAKTAISAKTMTEALPVNAPDTPEELALSKGAGLEDLQKRVPKAPWNVTATDSGGAWLVDTLRKELIPKLEEEEDIGVIPESVIMEANKLVSVGGGEDDELFSMDKSVNPQEYIKILRQLMVTRGQSDENRKERATIAKAKINENLAAARKAIEQKAQYNPLFRP